MKKSELKEIIRECIEEIIVDEQELDEKTPNQKAHPRPNLHPRRGPAGGRPNTVVGATDKLKDRENLSIPALKTRIRTDKKYDRPGFVDTKDGLKTFKPKSSYKKSGVGKKR